MVKRRMTRGDAGAGGPNRKAEAAKPQAGAIKTAEAPEGKATALPATKMPTPKPPAAKPPVTKPLNAAAKPMTVQAALNESVSKPALALDAHTAGASTASVTPAPTKEAVKPQVAPDVSKAPTKEPSKPVVAKAPVKPPETTHAAPVPAEAKVAEAPKPEPVKPEPVKPAAAKPAEIKTPEIKPIEAKAPEPKAPEPAPTPEPAATAKPAAPPVAAAPSEPAPPAASAPEVAKPLDVKPVETKPQPVAPAALKPLPVAARLPVAANTDHPAPKPADGPLRLHLSTQALDIGGIGDTVVGYLRSEGAAALAHLKALGTAKSPADVIRLQVGEMQRVADASLTVWSELARKASRAVELRR